MNESDVVRHGLVPDFCASRVLVLGCGNVLLGDDGLGPAVIGCLQSRYRLPDDVCIVDTGTAVRDLLCTIALSPVKPQRIVVIDAADRGKNPGEVTVETVENALTLHNSALSVHLLPTLSLLTELTECCGVDVKLVTVQPANVPEVVCPGLSPPVEAAVQHVCQCVVQSCL